MNSKIPYSYSPIKQLPQLEDYYQILKISPPSVDKHGLVFFNVVVKNDFVKSKKILVLNEKVCDDILFFLNCLKGGIEGSAILPSNSE